jgi:hypothetical protein
VIIFADRCHRAGDLNPTTRTAATAKTEHSTTIRQTVPSFRLWVLAVQ